MSFAHLYGRNALSLRCNNSASLLPRSGKFHWRTFPPALIYLRADTSEFAKMESQMAWKAPKIVEVPCGMEINMYVSATRK